MLCLSVHWPMYLSQWLPNCRGGLQDIGVGIWIYYKCYGELFISPLCIYPMFILFRDAVICDTGKSALWIRFKNGCSSAIIETGEPSVCLYKYQLTPNLEHLRIHTDAEKMDTQDHTHQKHTLRYAHRQSVSHIYINIYISVPMRRIPYYKRYEGIIHYSNDQL